MDGVKLIADAIRKEKAEKLNTMQPTAPVNVSDVTAQFTGKVENTKDTGKEQETKDNKTKEQETRKEETNNDDIN